jgi:hypothetical protein
MKDERTSTRKFFSNFARRTRKSEQHCTIAEVDAELEVDELEEVQN